MDDGEGDEWVDVNPNGPLEVPEWGCQDTFKEGRRFGKYMIYASMTCGSEGYDDFIVILNRLKNMVRPVFSRMLYAAKSQLDMCPPQPLRKDRKVRNGMKSWLVGKIHKDA
jgi:hypothetical protein